MSYSWLKWVQEDSGTYVIELVSGAWISLVDFLGIVCNCDGMTCHRGD